MAPPSVTVTVVDEGYFQKAFRFSPTTNLKRLIDAYCTHICTECTDLALLDFWYETTQVTAGHTPQALGMETGDVIDVRVKEQCTRGTCPLPASQKHPNIHYLVESPHHEAGEIQEQEDAPQAPDRITMTIRELNGAEMTLRTKVDTKFSRMMHAFAAQIQREVKDLRFCIDGARITNDDTPKTKLEMMEGDLIEVFYETIGGSSAPTEELRSWLKSSLESDKMR